MFDTIAAILRVAGFSAVSDGGPRDMSGPSRSENPPARPVVVRPVGPRGVAALRTALGDSALARAILDLILAAHEVNRWDLTDRAVNDLCEAAQRYVGQLDRVRSEHGVAR